MDKDCSICLSKISIAYEIECLYCNNTFHDSCIWKWERENISCPICRCKKSFEFNYYKQPYCPNLPPGFMIWGERSIFCAKEYSKTIGKIDSSDQDLYYMSIEIIEKKKLFVKLMTKKYGPRILYN